MSDGYRIAIYTYISYRSGDYGHLGRKMTEIDIEDYRDIMFL